MTLSCEWYRTLRPLRLYEPFLTKLSFYILGHIEFLKRAKQMGDYLLVGIHDDQTVNAIKGVNYPLMNLHERVLSVLACRVSFSPIHFCGIQFDIDQGKDIQRTMADRGSRYLFNSMSMRSLLVLLTVSAIRSWRRFTRSMLLSTETLLP